MAKTYRELFQQVEHDYGITTDAMFHVDLNKTMTDEEYENRLKFYSVAPEIFDDVFKGKFDEDDSDDDL